jgi:hypothetical protein
MRVVALVLLIAFISMAQSNQGSISGVITDAQGALIPSAKVSATSAATDVRTDTVTNDAGFYSIPNLPIGAYTVTAEREGFRRSVRDGITLTTGQSLELNIRMELGAVSETVKITAEAPLIETRTSDVTQLIESKSIENLPLGNRRTLNVINLTGAAVFVRYNNTPGNANPDFSLAGGRTQSQMFWIDGGAGQNLRIGQGQINLDPPVETVGEIKILSNNNSAEYGGSAGGVIVETTKSGGNQFHGSAYEYLRNDLMDAPGFFAPISNGQKVKPELRYNVFGGTVGGPIRRDKTFFFFAYEGQRLRTGGVDTFTVPTLLQRIGDFSQTQNAAGKLIPIYDPGTTKTVNGISVRDAYAGNMIPAAQLDPVALRILQFYPLPNRTPDNISGANNFRGNYAAASSADFYMIKVDHSFSDRDKVTGRYFYNGGPNSNSSVFPDPGADPRNGSTNRQQYTYGNWTRTLSATMVNDLRFTYINRSFHNISAGLGGDYPEKLGLKGVPNDAFPQFAPAGFTTIGSNAQERRQFPIEQEQFVDNISNVRGRHALKFGAEARRSRNHEFNLPTVSGAFSFSTQPTGLPGNAATGSGLASMLLGFPTGFSQQQTQELDRHSWYFAGFAQDDWTVRPSLTLNFGVRWEIDTPMVDANNRMNSFDPLQINPVSGTPGVVKFLGLNGYRTTPYDGDWNNFAPRFGFAWKVLGSDKTVLRGGYGIFYAHPFDAGVPNSVALGFSLSTTQNSPDNGLTAPFYLRNGVPAVVATAPKLDDSFGAVPVGVNPNTAVTFFEQNRKTGYSQQFNLGVQRQLPGSAVVEVTVLGNLSRKLASSALPINQISPAILGPQHQSQKDRPFPQFSNVSIQSPTLGLANYYAAMVRFQKRYSRGLSFGGNYTWSRFFDNTNEVGATVGDNPGPYSNFYNRDADYGPSANDIRHRGVLDVVYELPFGKGKQWLTKGPLAFIAGGWSLADVTIFQSGAPFTVTTQTNSTNSFSSGGLRADVVRNPNLDPTARTIARWFDTAPFLQPAAFQFGNEGVGLLRGPGLVNFDMSLQRDFRFTERTKLQLRGEFFNALNRTNLALPGHTFGGPGFGLISSAGPARQVQVGARVTF